MNKNDKNEVQEKGKTLLEQTSGESSSPTFLGYLSSPSASATGAHSSYAEKHNRVERHMKPPLRRLNHLRRRGRTGSRSSSKERIKDMVSPGALKGLSLVKESKWSLSQRQEMQFMLDLKRSSGCSGSDVDDTHGSVSSRRTVKVAARIRGLTKGEQDSGAKRAITIDGKQISVIRGNMFTDADAEHVVKAAKLYGKDDWMYTFELDSLHWSSQDTSLREDAPNIRQSSQEDIYRDPRGGLGGQCPQWLL